MRRGGGKSKGTHFERKICYQLCAWWFGEPDAEDGFWRSHASGARATNRAKKGKDTTNQAGDICATRKECEPLLRYTTIETKCGRNKADPFALVDSKNNNEFGAFVKQARLASRIAEVSFWWIIHKRDYKEVMIYFPTSMYYFLCRRGSSVKSTRMVAFAGKANGVRVKFIGMRFDDFLARVDPKVFGKKE